MWTWNFVCVNIFVFKLIKLIIVEKYLKLTKTMIAQDNKGIPWVGSFEITTTTTTQPGWQAGKRRFAFQLLQPRKFALSLPMVALVGAAGVATATCGSLRERKRDRESQTKSWDWNWPALLQVSTYFQASGLSHLRLVCLSRAGYLKANATHTHTKHTAAR